MMLKEKKLEKLLIRLKNETDILGEIYDLMRDDIYRYIYSIVKSKEMAQDLTHDTFIQIYKNIHLYKENGHPKAWIITISRNITYMSFRKHNREQVVDYEIDAVDEGMKDIHDKMMIRVLLDKLSVEEREIIILHVVEGLTFKEISEIMEMKLTTVLNKYHRSLKKLKKSLEE